MEYEDYERENIAIIVHIEGDDRPETMSRDEYRNFRIVALKEGIKYRRLQ